MIEKFELKEKEPFHQVDLKIKEPDGIHEFGFVFDEEDRLLVTAYNVAIRELCKDKLGIFHQTGVTSQGSNQSGYHYWESMNGSGKEEFEKIIPEIHKLAEKNYNELDPGWLF